MEEDEAAGNFHRSKNGTLVGPAPRRDLYTCIEDLARNPTRQDAREAEIRGKVERIAREEKQNVLLREAQDFKKGETVLHTAIKFLQFKSDAEKRVITLLVENFPKFMLQDRSNTDYSGQTPLHMAVTKGNIWLVHTLLQYMSTNENRERKVSLLRRRATGQIFTNTVMMAEIPLSIAALTFNKGMFDLLLEHGADLDGVNRHGDNVCHSLIRYAYLYPDTIDDVLEMCRYINEDPVPFDNSPRMTRIRKLRRKVWVMENETRQNPLQLAASLGQHRLFVFIMNLPSYCCDNSNDGLFDIKIYDVTEIDAISTMSSRDITGTEVGTNPALTVEAVAGDSVFRSKRGVFRTSTLQTLLELEPSAAVQFILFPPLRRIIDRKWNLYRRYFYPWWLLHTAFMAVLTWYGLVRSHQDLPISSSTPLQDAPRFTNKIFQDRFVTLYGIVGLVYAVLCLCQELVRMLRGKMPWTLNSFYNPYSNGNFRVMFVLFGLCLALDFVLATTLDSYELYCLYGGLILGWFLFLFFLRAIRPFSFFTVLIQNVLVGDMFRFFVILAIELVAFAACIYMAMQASATSDQTFAHYGETMLELFKLMFGLGEVSSLLEARKPALAVILFVLFLVFTTILMVNSLIAMMSRTCDELVRNVGNVSARDMHWRLQRLSVVMFLESLLPGLLTKHVGEARQVLRYSDLISRRQQMTRYMMEVRSLQNIEPEEEAPTWDWGLGTALFHAMGNKLRRTSSVEPVSRERPWSGAADKVRQLLHKRTEKKFSKSQKDDSDKSSHKKKRREHSAEGSPSPKRQSQLEAPPSPQVVMTSDPTVPSVMGMAVPPARSINRQERLEIYHMSKACDCPEFECVGEHD